MLLVCPLGLINLGLSGVFLFRFHMKLIGPVAVAPDWHVARSMRGNGLPPVNDVVNLLEGESPSVALRYLCEIRRRHLEHLADHTVALSCGPMARRTAQSEFSLANFGILSLGCGCREERQGGCAQKSECL